MRRLERQESSRSSTAMNIHVMSRNARFALNLILVLLLDCWVQRPLSARGLSWLNTDDSPNYRSPNLVDQRFPEGLPPQERNRSLISEGAALSGGIPFETHSFSTNNRKLVLNGLELFHSQCRACGRDFVRTAGTHHWTAAYVGVFSIEVLPDEISQRWLSEPCSGERCASDEVDRLLRKDFASKRREL